MVSAATTTQRTRCGPSTRSINRYQHELSFERVVVALLLVVVVVVVVCWWWCGGVVVWWCGGVLVVVWR